jgi:hypothetical protein
MLRSPRWVGCVQRIGYVGRMTSETGQLLQNFGGRDRLIRSPHCAMGWRDRNLVAITVLEDAKCYSLPSYRAQTSDGAAAWARVTVTRTRFR